jgi:hypothetical protein
LSHKISALCAVRGSSRQPLQRTVHPMTRFNKGDRVKCRGEIYYVVGNPTIASLGHMYEISKIPPNIKVLADELELASDEGETLDENQATNRRSGIFD